MKVFFEHRCHKCGLVDEARFRFAGPHLKQVCNGCGFYVKFFDKALVPDVKEIKMRIWAISNQNVDLINAAKKAVDFAGGVKGLTEKLMYWNLYLQVRKMILEGLK